MYRENEEVKCIVGPMCNKLYTYFNAYVIAYTSYTYNMEPHYNESLGTGQF